MLSQPVFVKVGDRTLLPLSESGLSVFTKVSLYDRIY